MNANTVIKLLDAGDLEKLRQIAESETRGSHKEIVIEREPGYKIYYSDGRYFLDLHREIIHSYDTLAHAREAAYYAEVRKTKE